MKPQRLPKVNSPKSPPPGPTPLPPADSALRRLLPKIVQKSLQNSACCWDRFGVRFGSPKGIKNGSKIAPGSLPRRSWGPVPAGCCFRTDFWSIFDPPEPRKLSSRLGAVRFFMNLRFPLGHPKSTPKSSKNDSQKLPRRPPEGSKCR